MDEVNNDIAPPTAKSGAAPRGRSDWRVVLTPAERQALLTGILVLPLAASCFLVTGFCLLRVTQVRTADGTMRMEVRLSLSERDRRNDSAQIAEVGADQDADAAADQHDGTGADSDALAMAVAIRLLEISPRNSALPVAGEVPIPPARRAANGVRGPPGEA